MYVCVCVCVWYVCPYVCMSQRTGFSINNEKRHILELSQYFTCRIPLLCLTNQSSTFKTVHHGVFWIVITLRLVLTDLCKEYWKGRRLCFVSSRARGLPWLWFMYFLSPHISSILVARRRKEVESWCVWGWKEEIYCGPGTLCLLQAMAPYITHSRGLLGSEYLHVSDVRSAIHNPRFFSFHTYISELSYISCTYCLWSQYAKHYYRFV
jgi:hypothetical protein